MKKTILITFLVILIVFSAYSLAEDFEQNPKEESSFEWKAGINKAIEFGATSGKINEKNQLILNFAFNPGSAGMSLLQQGLSEDEQQVFSLLSSDPTSLIKSNLMKEVNPDAQEQLAKFYTLKSTLTSLQGILPGDTGIVSPEGIFGTHTSISNLWQLVKEYEQRTTGNFILTFFALFEKETNQDKISSLKNKFSFLKEENIESYLSLIKIGDDDKELKIGKITISETKKNTEITIAKTENFFVSLIGQGTIQCNQNKLQYSEGTEQNPVQILFDENCNIIKIQTKMIYEEGGTYKDENQEITSENKFNLNLLTNEQEPPKDEISIQGNKIYIYTKNKVIYKKKYNQQTAEFIFENNKIHHTPINIDYNLEIFYLGKHIKSNKNKLYTLSSSAQLWK